jgi:hypothetical protein
MTCLLPAAQEQTDTWRAVLGIWSHRNDPQGGDDTILRRFDRAAIIMSWSAPDQVCPSPIDTGPALDAGGNLHSAPFWLDVDGVTLTGERLLVRGWLD